MTSASTRSQAEADLRSALPPEQLIPGDLVALDEAVASSEVVGDQLASTARAINYIEINGDDWTGQSKAAYDFLHGTDIKSFKDAATVFDDVVTAVSGYNRTLLASRGQAQVALANYQTGTAQQAADDAARAQSCDPTATAPGPPLPTSSLFDPDPYGIQGAITTLVEARHAVEVAGSSAAKSLNALADLAPKKHHDSWSTQFKHRMSDTFHGFADPLWNMVRSPYDMLDDYMDGNWSDLPGDTLNVAMLAGLFAGRGGGSDEPPPLSEHEPGTSFNAQLTRLERQEFDRLAREHGLTPDQLAALTRGKGPVLKGLAGDNAMARYIEDQTNIDLKGRQITVHTTVNGQTVVVKPDLLGEDRSTGKLVFFDPKNGPTAGLTKNQGERGGYDAIRKHGFTPVGKNAEAAGLTPGKHYGPTDVWVVNINK